MFNHQKNEFIWTKHNYLTQLSEKFSFKGFDVNQHKVIKNVTIDDALNFALFFRVLWYQNKLVFDNILDLQIDNQKNYQL